MTKPFVPSRWPLWTAMRPTQWIKNSVVLAALIFAFGDTSQELLNPWLAFAALGCFCLLSSCIYLINDVQDIELDRVHPTKQYRPIPLGQLKPRTAVIAALTLLTLGLVGGWLINPWVFLSLAGYSVMQLGYCFGLKRVAFVDVMIIAAGFVIRALTGALAIDVVISPWLLGCTFLLATFLGFSKRRHEKVVLSDLQDRARPSLANYSEKVLDAIILLVAGATVMAYGLYTVSAATVEKFGSQKLIITVPLVALGLWRYYVLVYSHEEGGRPEGVLLTDRLMVFTIVGYGVLTLGLFLWA